MPDSGGKDRVFSDSRSGEYTSVSGASLRSDESSSLAMRGLFEFVLVMRFVVAEIFRRPLRGTLSPVDLKPDSFSLAIL